jgi:hypothetical protein
MASEFSVEISVESIRSRADSSLSELELLEAKLTAASENLPNLCMCCDSIRKSPEMNHIKQRATASEQHGNNQSPFAQVRHFIGRLAFHVRHARTLVSAARRLPTLFVDPEIEVVHCQSISIQPPRPRNQTTLSGIANRMIGNDKPLLLEIQARLQALNQAFDIERIVRDEYAKKSFKPRVHAELILLEHFYRNRDSLEFEGNDPYIGCSKPACYCCSLYIRWHPGQFVEPPSHQKIYLNWMPPTSSWDVQNPSSEIVNHERDMLNKMAELIRLKTISQIRAQGGPRQKHFDSVTGGTFSTIGQGEKLRSPQDDDMYSIADGLGKFIIVS